MSSKKTLKEAKKDYAFWKTQPVVPLGNVVVLHEHERCRSDHARNESLILIPIFIDIPYVVMLVIYHK
jgi:hypothetical protein